MKSLPLFAIYNLRIKKKVDDKLLKEYIIEINTRRLYKTTWDDILGKYSLTVLCVSIRKDTSNNYVNIHTKARAR